MTYPTKPARDYSYSAFEQAQGDGSFPGTQLDNDLSNLITAQDETIDFIEDAFRSDGTLANGTVHKNALSSDILLGLPAPRPWATATDYVVDDTATINNSLYICPADHTSGVFADDLADALWTLLIEFTVPASLADGSVTEPKHATGSTSTRALADNSVTAVKVPDGELPTAKLATTAQAAMVPIGGELDFSGAFPPPGYLFKAGQAISRTTYAALFAVLAPAVIGNVSNGSNTITGLVVDLRNLGLEGALIEGPGILGGSTISAVSANSLTLSIAAGGSATAAQVRLLPYGRGDGSSTFNLPDDKDRATIGRGNMGGSAAGRVTIAGAGHSGIDTSKLGAAGGADRHTLSEGQLAVHSHSASSSVSDPTHVHASGSGAGFQNVTAGGNFLDTVGGSAQTITTGTTANSATGIAVSTSINNAGSGEAHQNMPPSRVTNKIIFTGVVL